MQTLPGYRKCFVCGKDNPIGLNITFFKDKDKIRAEFIPESKHQGYKGIVHGGILFSILDEIMGRTAFINKGVMTLTVLTEARGKFIVISKEMQREVEEYFNF